MSLRMPIEPFNQSEVSRAAEQFDIKTKENDLVYVIKAEILSPDSTAVLLMIGKNFYVIYSEDFIDSLDIVKQQIEEWLPGKVRKFIDPLEPSQFETSGNSQYYMQPDYEKIDDWMPKAIVDGRNFAFLAEVIPNESSNFWVLPVDEGPHPDLPPEIANRTRKISDPNKTFLENWQAKNS